MTEAEWLAGDDPAAMIAALANACWPSLLRRVFPVGRKWRRSDRKLRLLLCATSHYQLREYPLEVTDDPRQFDQYVREYERYADGEVTHAHVENCFPVPPFSFRDHSASLGPGVLSKYTPHLLSVINCRHWEGGDWSLRKAVEQVGDVANNAIFFDAVEANRLAQERFATAVSNLLRDIFGNPFRPVAFNPAWRTSAAVALATQMYGSRDFGNMPVLGDALEDAGCDNADVIAHCRDPHGVHVRGCWVVDLVLGKS
jgi:hypothetical protein